LHRPVRSIMMKRCGGYDDPPPANAGSCGEAPE
jgi:hypothetical protein